MELYTSHWRNENLAELAGEVLAVGISRGGPRRKMPYPYKLFPVLRPSKELFGRWHDGVISPEEYTPVYRGYLDTLEPEEIIGGLRAKQAGGEAAVALLCWCLPGEFCHRRVFADWCHEKTGLLIPEVGPPKPKG